MSNQPRNRTRQSSSGNSSPRRGRNTISTGVVVVALLILLLVQFSAGRLGDLFDTSATVDTGQGDGNNSDVDVNADGEAGRDGEADNEAEDEVAVAATPAEPPAEAESEQSARATATPRSTPRPTPTANAPPAQSRASDLPTIAYAELPAEAHETIALIEEHGPFPFDRDGITFQNREGLLPDQPRGYYREYTVITPGISHRGARRIVTGDAGEMYYTDDHYESFREIIR